MNFLEEFKDRIFTINEENFEDSSLAAFEYQFHQSPIYHQYCSSLGKTPSTVKSLHEIPFLPIEFFKSHEIKSGKWESKKIFKSSGTTSTSRSNHHVEDPSFYHHIAKTIFEAHFGQLPDLTILALLPSYQEQGDSSLISMVDFFQHRASKDSGYFLNQKGLNEILLTDAPKILIGVSYALLDLSDTLSRNTIVIETGGMKGRKKEITRSELHEAIENKISPLAIWSEYGMTELLSQAYGEHGKFTFPAWAKVLIRETTDPFSYLTNEKTGGINVIDLANIHSCCFIETKDLGRTTSEHFEVLGRFDNSDIRGCNLLV